MDNGRRIDTNNSTWQQKKNPVDGGTKAVTKQEYDLELGGKKVTNTRIPVSPICRLFIAFIKPPVALHFTVQNVM
ncbi:hypothetical protein F2P81_024256 [Scophthalmus maximus]|uniref:Uncharacterized protein n=1 Tax=Scophthalmus maximus TaxID=52904 RepID=A0A6A4RM92_SCOMX|nr:hypothetical protein F2P81_024256 [Scophthalmus maximus]